MRESLFETLVGLAVVAVAGFFLVFSLSQRSDAATGDTYELIAKFDRADGVSPGTDVRVAGVKVGAVKSVSLDQKTYKAEAVLAIRNSSRRSAGSRRANTGTRLRTGSDPASRSTHVSSRKNAKLDCSPSAAPSFP